MTNRRVRREKGAAAVEFALVALLLIGLLMGIVNFGVIVAQKASLNGAVRAAARYGSVNIIDGDHTCSNIKKRASEEASTVGMDGGDVTFAIYRQTDVPAAGDPGAICSDDTQLPCEDSNEDDFLYVVATYDSKLFVPAPERIIDATIGLESVGAYRCEYN